MGHGLKCLLPFMVHGRQNGGGEAVKMWPLLGVKPEPFVKFWMHWYGQMKANSLFLLPAGANSESKQSLKSSVVLFQKL